MTKLVELDLDAQYFELPVVTVFPNVTPDKDQALKVLEEAAEVFAEWQKWDKKPSPTGEVRIVDECADVIQSVCNLLASLGYYDMTEAMERCERRNKKRGRYKENSLLARR